MIFASDLDRTIFYSNRALKELGMPEKSCLKPVEIKDGLPIGFMTEPSYLSLLELCRHSLFIPVTTRTTEQFRRFILFNTFCPTYVITSNGANIFYKGSTIADWKNDLLKQIRHETVVQEELLSKLKKEGFKFEGEKRQAEPLFFYYILNSLPSKMEKEIIKRTANYYGWKVSLQGRKLYFIPNAVNKGAALSFICNREGKEAYAGAGDSILDWDFLQYCSHRFVPSHGELAASNGEFDFTLTRKSGAAAGEEILQQFLSLLRLKI